MNRIYLIIGAASLVLIGGIAAYISAKTRQSRPAVIHSGSFNTNTPEKIDFTLLVEQLPDDTKTFILNTESIELKQLYTLGFYLMEHPVDDARLTRPIVDHAAAYKPVEDPYANDEASKMLTEVTSSLAWLAKLWGQIGPLESVSATEIEQIAIKCAVPDDEVLRSTAASALMLLVRIPDDSGGLSEEGKAVLKRLIKNDLVEHLANRFVKEYLSGRVEPVGGEVP